MSRSVNGAPTAARTRLGTVLSTVVILVVCGAATWMLVRWVISDEEVFLEFLRVLVWPCVVGMVLYWLRVPLREKFGQLLRVEGFGASALFSADAQGRRLTQDLTPDLTALFEQGLSNESEDEAGSIEDDHGEEELEADESSGSDDSGREAAEARERGERGERGERASDDQPADSHQRPVVEHIERPESPALTVEPEQILDLARALGVSQKTLKQMERDVEERHAHAVSDILRYLQSRARTRERNRTMHNTQQSRDSIEAVIRKSAAWGYDMGKAGAPKTIPDVEWHSDGTWKITTEVPPVPSERQVDDRSDEARSDDRLRQIKSLEDEIKKLERLRHGPFHSTMANLNDEPWLSELKRRLRAVDPGNPWALR